jgi:hypothetical protein
MFDTLDAHDRIRAVVFLLIVLLAGPLAFDASAQYFGQNKVQYRTFDFRIRHRP